MTPIAPLIEAFFRERLSQERGVSQNTLHTYAYSFQLLFVFAKQQLNIPPSALSLEHIDASLVSSFLEHLETVRNNTPLTRNARLAAIKSFMRYVEYRVPAALEQVRRVLAIPSKKSDTRLIAHLSKEEIDALIDVLDETSRSGIRDRAMIYVCLTAGLRVSELIGLRSDDLTIRPKPSILIRGKGRKERALPLWKESADAMNAWLAVRGETKSPEIFVNNRGEAMTRWGFRYILDKYVARAAEKCPSLRDKKVTPHVLRHTCAMVILQATKDIRKVSLWLGHESMQSTEIYLRADPSEKLEILNALVPPSLKKGRFIPTDKLMSILKASILCGEKNKASPSISEERLQYST